MKSPRAEILGFTLIELMIVIAIIGILSMIGLSSFERARDQARDARRKSDFSQIRLGLEMYKTDNVGYPLPEGGDPDGSEIPPVGSIFSLVSNPLLAYLAGIPVDPINSGGQEYVYSASVDSTKYVLCAPFESTSSLWYNLYETGEYEYRANCNFVRL